MNTHIQRFYQRWEGTIQIMTLVMIPLVVYLYGQSLTRSIEQAKTEQNYVRIATGILSQKVADHEDQTAIRTWASDVLQKYSPVAMSLEQREKLISGAARTSVHAVGYDDWGYNDYKREPPIITRPVPSMNRTGPADE